MNLRSSASNLTQAVKNLSVQWQQARGYWRDAKSMEFEERYLEPLPNLAARASAVIEEIDAVLRKIKADCE